MMLASDCDGFICPVGLQAVLWEKSDIWNMSKTLQLRTEAAFGFMLAILFFLYGWCAPHQTGCSS
jgi:hypothetical protein